MFDIPIGIRHPYSGYPKVYPYYARWLWEKFCNRPHNTVAENLISEMPFPQHNEFQLRRYSAGEMRIWRCALVQQLDRREDGVHATLNVAYKSWVRAQGEAKLQCLRKEQNIL